MKRLLALTLVLCGCGGGMKSPTVSAPVPVVQPTPAPPSTPSPTPPPPTPPPPSPPPSTVPSIPTSWTLTDLPPIPGATASQANAVNSLGHAVGYSVLNFVASATLWNGQTVELGENSVANAINDSDQIAGYRNDANSLPHAHLWPDDIDLGVLADFDSSIATGINAAGTIVGVAFDSANPANEQAFVWTRSTGMQPVLGCASAEAINDAGAIAGISMTLNATVCGNADYGLTGAATAINSQGQAVGYGGSDPDAFLWPSMELGVTSLATGINDDGFVVGYQITQPQGSLKRRFNPHLEGVSAPWIWSLDSGIVPLPNLATANGIKGNYVVGAGVVNGIIHGMLLTGD